MMTTPSNRRVAVDTAPTRAHSRPLPRGLSSDLTFVRRSLLHSARDVEALLMAIALPVLLMLMFTYVFGGALDSSGRYVDYVVPGIILTCAGYGAASTALSVADDMTSGFIARLQTMPVRAGGVITGHIVASLVRNLLATTVVFLVALAIGFRPDADPGEWSAAIALIIGYILAITCLFAAIGLAAGSPESANGYGFILLFLPYVSSGFVPVETMPGWLAAIAERQPLTPIIETLRGLLLGTDMGGAPLSAVLWCTGIVVLAIAWSARLFRTKTARR